MTAARRGRRALAASGVALLATAGVAVATAGDPDPGFYFDGRRTFGYGGDDRATDVAVLRDGRILVAAGRP